MNQQKSVRPRQQRAAAQSKASSSPTPKPPEKHATQPAPDDREGWKAHWERHQQPWRTEPEISNARREELAAGYAVPPDIEKGIYPCRGIKLSRADVEWLLATHQKGQGPVDWDDENQRGRDGLDVRGANLSLIDLSHLPLARLRGGLTIDEWKNATEDGRKNAVIIMEMSNLNETHLEGAILTDAHLKKSYLSGAYLQESMLKCVNLENATLDKTHMRKAILIGAQMEGVNLDGVDMEEADINFANLSRASLKKTNLRKAIISANLEYADLKEANMEGAALNIAKLKGAKLIEARLESAMLGGADLTEANLNSANLKGALLGAACLERANLNRAQLTKAHLNSAHLEGANLTGAHLEEADLSMAHLEGADFRGANLNGASLENTTLATIKHVGPRIADIQWGTVNLAVIEWEQIKMLGDEYEAQQKGQGSNAKSKDTKLSEYKSAVRANRQLAVLLEAQGLNEEASRFAYRANMLQRKVLWFQMMQPEASLRQRVRKFRTWVFSHFLNLLAGYGYRPGRSGLAYLLVVFGFMGIYLIISHFAAPHLSWDESLVLSLSSFHGRGFFPQTITLSDPYARAAVAEAILGLLVEVSLIATFTQRFFGK